MVSEIEQALKKKSRGRKRIRKVSKLDFIVNLYRGKPGKEGDEVPLAPITSISELADKLREAEDKGYFRVRTGTKMDRTKAKYESETKWYLTQAAKKGLIEREYNPRKTHQ